MIIVFEYIFLFSALLLIAAVLIFVSNLFYNTIRVKVPYIKTSRWAIKTTLKEINPKKEDKVVELGCGNARVIRAIKKKYPEIKARGYEVAWWPYLKAKQKIKKDNLNIDLIRKNFYNVDLSDSDIIFCFLISSVMPRLEKKLKKELKPGAIVISYIFTFPHWPAKKVIKNPKRSGASRINIYQKT
ncbi:MAG: class I SAM-dependent methyltransferase [Patescibacteria group bacterium]|nr:class I SAM-dependent methyltransferase [Patescibacteria group bacterium]